MLSRPEDFAALQGQDRQVSPPAGRSHPPDRPRGDRFGLSTGRKLGGAVVRNRVRGDVREALRVMAPSFQPGWDVLIIARPAVVAADFEALVGTYCNGSSAGEAFSEDRTVLVKRSGSGSSRLYRIVFAWLPSICRYEPTCSLYTEQAIAEVRSASREAGWEPGGSPAATRGIPVATTRSAR